MLGNFVVEEIWKLTYSDQGQIELDWLTILQNLPELREYVSFQILKACKNFQFHFLIR